MNIEKKCAPKFFKAILDGRKTFEIRLADWKCKAGDVLVLREWNSKQNEYTGRILKKKITYALKTKDLKFFTKNDIDKYGFQVIAFH